MRALGGCSAVLKKYIRIMLVFLTGFYFLVGSMHKIIH